MMQLSPICKFPSSFYNSAWKNCSDSSDHYNNIICLDSVADPGGGGGGKGGASVPPFGLHLTLRSIDDKLNGTPLSRYRSKKTAAVDHLRML